MGRQAPDKLGIIHTLPHFLFRVNSALQTLVCSHREPFILACLHEGETCSLAASVLHRIFSTCVSRTRSVGSQPLSNPRIVIHVLPTTPCLPFHAPYTPRAGTRVLLSALPVLPSSDHTITQALASQHSLGTLYLHAAVAEVSELSIDGYPFSLSRSRGI